MDCEASSEYFAALAAADSGLDVDTATREYFEDRGSSKSGGARATVAHPVAERPMKPN